MTATDDTVIRATVALQAILRARREDVTDARHHLARLDRVQLRLVIQAANQLAGLAGIAMVEQPDAS